MSRKLSGNRQLLHLTVQMGIRFIKMGINNLKTVRTFSMGMKSNSNENTDWRGEEHLLGKIKLRIKRELGRGMGMKMSLQWEWRWVYNGNKDDFTMGMKISLQWK